MTESLPDSNHSSGARRADRHRHRATRVRFAPAAILGAVAASAVIALSMSGTLAGFVAQITNNGNTASSGTLTLSETQGGTVCNSNAAAAPQAATNTVNCAINKFNGSTTIVPGAGGAVTASVTMKNTGTSNASTFTLTPLACSQVLGAVNGGATDACSKFTLTVVTGSTTVASGNLTALATAGAITLPTLASGASATYTFTLTLPTQATGAAPLADNAYQGITVNQNLVWQLNS